MSTTYEYGGVQYHLQPDNASQIPTTEIPSPEDLSEVIEPRPSSAATYSPERLHPNGKGPATDSLIPFPSRMDDWVQEPPNNFQGPFHEPSSSVLPIPMVDTRASSREQTTSEHIPLARQRATVQKADDGRFCCYCGRSMLDSREGDCRRHLTKHNGPHVSCQQSRDQRVFYRHEKLRAHMMRCRGTSIARPGNLRKTVMSTSDENLREEPQSQNHNEVPKNVEDHHSEQEQVLISYGTTTLLEETTEVSRLSPGATVELQHWKTPILESSDTTRMPETENSLPTKHDLPEQVEARGSGPLVKDMQVGELLETPNTKTQEPRPLRVREDSQGSHASHKRAPSDHTIPVPRDNLPLAMEIGDPFRPSMYQLEPGFGFSSQALPFQTNIFRNSDFNTAHYLSPDFQPEQWCPDEEHAGEVSSFDETMASRGSPVTVEIISQTDQKPTKPLFFSPSLSVLHHGDDSYSTGSTYAASIFSIESLQSDATSISQDSGYSANQIASATKELVTVFQTDEILVPLYKRAIAEPAIGPDRLQRNLHRLFKAFARDLGEEYEERLEFLASRFVAMRARYLAKSIVDNFRPSLTTQKTSVRESYDSGEESPGEEQENSSVDDSYFKDLKMFRQFLVGSSAFIILRAQMQSFVIPKSSDSAAMKSIGSKDDHNESFEAPKMNGQNQLGARTWTTWRNDLMYTLDLLARMEFRPAAGIAIQLILDAFSLITDGAFVAMGLLEPGLVPGMTRLRWTCRCGDNLWSDVRELENGGVKELIAHMERTAGCRVVPAAYNEQPGNQRYIIPKRIRWFGNRSNVCHMTKQQPVSTCSAASSNSTSTITCTSSQGSLPGKPMLHLMACMHNKRSSKILQQDRIENITTDCALVDFMRCQYRRCRSRIRSILSLKNVQGIYFVKFHLPMGNNVIIRPHGVSCMSLDSTSNTPTPILCECLPPRAKVEPISTAEYDCQPVPPKTFPPVPPEYLLSLFTCQEEPHAMSRWIVEQLPKRKWGELFGKPEQPAEGWGIYYKEGWDTGLIAIVVFVLLSASLLFSVLWTKFRGDIQGAFGVGAWMVGIGGALLAVIVTQADSV